MRIIKYIYADKGVLCKRIIKDIIQNRFSTYNMNRVQTHQQSDQNINTSADRLEHNQKHIQLNEQDTHKHISRSQKFQQNGYGASTSTGGQVINTSTERLGHSHINRSTRIKHLNKTVKTQSIDKTVKVQKH